MDSQDRPLYSKSYKQTGSEDSFLDQDYLGEFTFLIGKERPFPYKSICRQTGCPKVLASAGIVFPQTENAGDARDAHL